MLNAIIEFSLRHRFLVVLSALLLAAGGALSLSYLNIDAFPDTTPVQVQINTVAPALAPEEVERQITFPIEQVLSGLPGLEEMRSISKFALSQIVVTFADGTNIYFARQLVNERLGTAVLPAGIDRPKMGPVATGLGEVFHYVVGLKNVDMSRLPDRQRQEKLEYLRTIHDWVIRPRLKTVKGVAEVNSWGGNEKQYQVRLAPERLIKHELTFEQVVTALQKNNKNVGGGNIRENAEMLLVQGLGRTANVEEIKNIVIAARDGVPTRIKDVADVEIGHEVRRGAVTADGKGEVVLGLGFMLMGENSHVVTRNLKAKMSEIQELLATSYRDVDIHPVYDRTELVDFVIGTVRSNLFEGGLLVVAVLFLFLGNLRAAAIVALAIPLSMLFAFSGMLRFGIAASLLSLGAIDFGMIVDSSVVMIENCVHHMGSAGLERRSKIDIIRDAAVEVRKPTLFGELIIMIVYLPILTLEGTEGKLYRPMALTVIFALIGSMLLSLTLMPVLASLLPRRVQEREPLLMRLAHRIHSPLLRICMEHKLVVLGIAGAVLVFAFGMIGPNLGTEFVPRLSEGALVAAIVRVPGTDLAESVRANTQLERALLRGFPEVEHVWSRIGSAEIATDPMGVEETDFFISLKPRDQWQAVRDRRVEQLRRQPSPPRELIGDLAAREADTQAELLELIQKELRQLPGQRLSFSQPIEQRINEMVSGVKTDVGIKLFGDDLEVLRTKAAEIERVLKTIPGNADVSVEQVTGQPVLQVKIDQDQIARHGVPAAAVLELVESLGSKHVGEVVDGPFRFPLVIRLPEEVRRDRQTVGAMLLATAAGERIPLRQLADIRVVAGPSTIRREWAQRMISIRANIRGRDMGGFVAEAQRKIKQDVIMPNARYYVSWSGQFEHYESARNRLLIVIPVAIVLIFSLLYFTYSNVVDALRVFTGVPLGWVGGVIALWLRGMPFSISAAVGFIAMSGVAVLDDMILVSYIRQLRRQGKSRDAAVREAAVTRLRPVLMTTLVASLGFLPMAFSTGMGAEVQRPLATVVVGGVISAMLMSLLVIRVLYVVFDSLGEGMQWLLTRWLGFRTEQLGWLFGGDADESVKEGSERRDTGNYVAAR